MYFVSYYCSLKDALSNIRLMTLAAILLLITCGTVGAQPGQVVSAEPYPIGDLRILREDITTQSFRLHLTNLQVAARIDTRVQTQHYFIAGVRGQVPTLEVESATYVFLKDGQETSSTEEVPAQLRQNLVRVADMGLLRQYWVHTLAITTGSPQGSDSMWVLKDASVKVDLGNPSMSAGQAQAGKWKAGFGEAGLAPGLLLNPDVAPEYYAFDYNDPVEAWQGWSETASAAAASGNLFRFSIFGGGVFRLSPEDLSQATTAPLTTLPSQWRVYRNGQEVSLLADPANADGAVYLPIAPSEADGLREAVYWLITSAAGDGGQPARLSIEDNSVVAEGVPVDNQLGIMRVQHREFENYNPKLKAGPGGDRWYWTDVDVNNPATVEMEMPEHYAPAEDSSVKLTIRYGFTNFPPVQPQLLVYARGHDAVGTTLTTQQGTAHLEVPADMFKPGNNQVALRLDYPPMPGGQRPVVVQDIVTEWTQPLVAGGSTYTFRPAEASSTGSVSLKFQDSLSASQYVLGYGNSGATVLRSEGNQVLTTGGAFSAYQVLNLSQTSTVSRLQAVKKPFRLQDVESAESVIISAPELMEGAEAVLQSQQERGLTSKIFTSQELFDIFSYGNPDPAGIRNALRYMFYKSPGVAPEYVTLIGEASDFRGDPSLVPAHVQLNMIPSSAAETPESPQGDHQYAAAIGSDQVVDFIVGRLSASKVSQVLDYVAKAKEYEAGTAGEWSRITQFVMDDNDEFPDVVSRIVRSGMSPTANTSLLRQWDYEYVPNLRVQGKKRSWTATDELINKFNSGFGILNFFGHGGPNLWSHERLLHLSDMPLITNSTQLPLITCASCDNAWITYPMPPVKASMGELMVLKRDGGAIGLFGPVAGASPYEHSTLVQSLMEGITRSQIRRTGDAIFHAKSRYYGITRSASVPEQYLLLGDPTVELKMPRVEPGLVNSEPTLRAGEDQALSIRLAEGGKVDSAGILRLTTSSGDEVSSIAVSAGESSWSVPLPADFGGGAVLAALERQTPEGLALDGTAVRVLPQKASDETARFKVTTGTGDAYSIEPISANVSADAGAAASYKFKLITADTTSDTVRIVATHEGEKIGEASHIVPPGPNSETDFEISTNSVFSTGTTTSISLDVFPVDSAATAAALATAQVVVPVKSVAELEFVPGSGRVYSESGVLVSGATVFFEGEIRNTGHRAAENFTLQGLRDDPSTGTELQTINDSTGVKIERLEPGEARKVVFRWENVLAGSVDKAFLVANRNKVVHEQNYTNNHLQLPPFEVVPVGNFTIPEFTVTPEYATPGTTVTVTARVANNLLLNDRPVTVEVGWERSFDGETTSTKLPITFVDGSATFTRHLVTPEAFTHIFVKVNSDMELEELDPGDNTTHTASMIVYDMPAFEETYSLADSFEWGTAYNLDRMFEGQLQVSTDFSSTTELLIMDIDNVTSGNVTTADDPTDDKWFMVLWRLAAGKDEEPGPVSLRLPLSTVAHDIPGNLYGFFLPFEGAGAPVEVKLHGATEWTSPKRFGEDTHRLRLDFGRTTTVNRALEWQMRKAGNTASTLEFLRFYPRAVEWNSSPYLLPEELRSQRLMLQIETGNAQSWEQLIIDRRSGVSDGNGGITWRPWSSARNSMDVPVFGEEYLQIRFLGVPKDGQHPYIENVRISRQ